MCVLSPPHYTRVRSRARVIYIIQSIGIQRLNHSLFALLRIRTISTVTVTFFLIPCFSFKGLFLQGTGL